MHAHILYINIYKLFCWKPILEFCFIKFLISIQTWPCMGSWTSLDSAVAVKHSLSSDCSTFVLNPKVNASFAVRPVTCIIGPASIFVTSSSTRWDWVSAVQLPPVNVSVYIFQILYEGIYFPSTPVSNVLGYIFSEPFPNHRGGGGVAGKGQCR